MSDDNKGTVSYKVPSLIAQIHISVRGLVEFVLRHGDIDNRRKASSGPEVMLEGANIHRMIQRRMGSEYHAEQYLKYVYRREEYEIVIDGRADGIIIPSCFDAYVDECKAISENAASIDDDFTDKYPLLPSNYLHDVDGSDSDGDKIIIDEIKTTYRELERMKEAEPVHLAQAKVYAYIYATLCKLPTISVRMTYVNTQSHETRYFDEDYTYEAISSWFDELMKKYIRWADFSVNWKRERNATIDGISFPYEYRAGQKELVAQVFKSIEKKERLFEMAPTGVGKTLANLYPSLKALSMGRGEKIFYLTAKTITRTVASDCLNLLRKQALRLKSVTLTAKEKSCPLESCDCNPVKCPYAKGHYDRINDAMYDLLMNEDEFSREVLLEYANKHTVCPFELTLDMSLFSDCIICDYNYVFDPNVYLRRFFGDGVTGDYLFLIDEAHNLPDRAMSMYSAQLVKERMLDVKHLVRETDSRLARAIEGCNKAMLALKRNCDKVMVVEEFEELVAKLLTLIGKIEQFMDDYERFEEMDEVLDFYFEVRHFLYIYENMDNEDYVQYTKHEDNGDFVARLMCANPAGWIKRCVDRAKFTVFFSATLIPLDYYRMMLGASPSDPAVYAKSVFDPNKRALLVARDVTSKYTRRSDSEYEKMASYIHEVSSAKPGNYIVFLPSFAMLESVSNIYMDMFADDTPQEVIIQTSQMREDEREDFIARFTDSEATVLGFCVLGGIFSEGIDLKNEALIGAIIIGTGLPMVCPERELLKYRYDDMGLDGFAYAYRYPGMNKVLQAAGRVIRTAEDQGVVALLDERFLNREYLALFPREWSNYRVCRADDISENLDEFWS